VIKSPLLLLSQLWVNRVILGAGSDFRFTPESGHEGGRRARPLWAKSGLTRCNIKRTKRKIASRGGLSEI